MTYPKKHGFTLIELLVVIAIIGILTTLLVTNLAGARARASDTKKKGNLRELKTALHLYYTNFHTYPKSVLNNGFNFYACGALGTEKCTTSFTAGGAEYLVKLPQTSSGQNDFRYYPCNTGDDFRLKINVSNASDPELAPSQARCPASTCVGQSLSYGTTDYVLCGE